MKIALLRERKQPADSRVALSPLQAQELQKNHPSFTVVAEASPERVFTDEEYKQAGIEVVSDVSDCDVLLGVKEVPIEFLIPHKTYFFFSHTIKEQPYNQQLMQALIAKNIRMIDYETLVWPKGGRILGFGRWAGIVGTYNGFLTWGKKYGSFELTKATSIANYDDLKTELNKVSLPPIKIALTGTGRVAKGALEVLEHCGITQVETEDFVSKNFDEPVFTQLTNRKLYQRKDGLAWDTQHFYNNHQAYTSQFDQYLEATDLLINGMYWENTLPTLFTKEDTQSKSFNIKVIADITCDVEGSVPITLRATSIEDPTIGWDTVALKETEPFTADSLDVMAVTNLPTEMPRSASEDFGSVFCADIAPLLNNLANDPILKTATICEDGHLGTEFGYLKQYAGIQ